MNVFSKLEYGKQNNIFAKIINLAYGDD